MTIKLHIKDASGVTWMTEERDTWEKARQRAVHLFFTFPDIEVIAAQCSSPKGAAFWEFDTHDQVLVEWFATGVVHDGPADLEVI